NVRTMLLWTKNLRNVRFSASVTKKPQRTGIRRRVSQVAASAENRFTTSIFRANVSFLILMSLTNCPGGVKMRAEEELMRFAGIVLLFSTVTAHSQSVYLTYGEWEKMPSALRQMYVAGAFDAISTVTNRAGASVAKHYNDCVKKVE